MSLYDNKETVTTPYFSSTSFQGFSKNRGHFIVKSFGEGIKNRVVVLSHVNLLLVGYLIKLFSPGTQLVLIAHGIELWKPLPFFKRQFLKSIDCFVAVSQFTKEKLQQLFAVTENKCVVINNCLDPFLPTPATADNRQKWRQQLNIDKEATVLLTLSRLSVKEKNKGYDKVLTAIKELEKEFPDLRYLFVGKYEESEKERLDELAASLGIKMPLIFTGFVDDNLLSFYYNVADVYMMPSEKEGFGISFIEAMYYSIPVIAGNRDGSVDALLNGLLGTLVDPRNQNEITSALRNVLLHPEAFQPNQELLMKHFSYPVYKSKWMQVVASHSAA